MKRCALLLVLAAGCDREPIEVTEAPVEPAAVQAPPNPAGATPFEPTREEHPDGLVVETLSPGTGSQARQGNRIQLHYTGTIQSTGEVFSDTRATGIPFAFTLGRGEVIRGLDRGLKGARTGSRIRLSVPSSLAYGEDGWGKVPEEADLEFDIHIVQVE